MSISYPEFHSPWWMPGGDLQTLLPVVLRPLIPDCKWIFITLPDGDRLSADFYSAKNPTSKKLLIVTHGLEGSSRQPYITGVSNAAQHQGYDVLAWNLRSCGLIDNVLPKVYYSGCSEDLNSVVVWAQQQGYSDIYLAAYSLGGNIVLKWLGEQGSSVHSMGVKSACVASAPVDLKGCVETLDQWRNFIYRYRFVSDMKKRIQKKANKFPGAIDVSSLDKIKTLKDYDTFIQAPLNGFDSVEYLYASCSALSVMANLAVPTLLVDAKNDPFLSESCYPAHIAEHHPWLSFEMTESGGHVGFLAHNHEWWLDARFFEFFKQHS